MYRFRLAIMFISSLTVAMAGHGKAAQAVTPMPSPTAKSATVKHVGGLSNPVRIRKSNVARVSAAQCNRRAVSGLPAPNGSLGPTGASSSQTIVSVPIGGGSVSSATREHQIAEACAHLRR